MKIQKAQIEDKQQIVDILTRSFDKNKSVNFVIKNDNKRVRRIQQLMGYSFNVCLKFGEAFISEDRNACALILNPKQKRTTFSTILLDIRLAFSAIGLRRVLTVLKRESLIKKHHPKGDFCHLWFIGVEPNMQRNGLGSEMLSFIIKKYQKNTLDIYLETSTDENIPWYKKFGFQVYQELDLTFTLSMMSLNHIRYID